MKKFLKVLLILFIILVFVILLLFLNGTYMNRKEEADISLSSWMNEIPDDVKLINIAIPGSHDAGTKGIIWLAETQGYTINEQLTFGARYFDIRVNKLEDGYKMYHSIFNGENFLVALNDIKEFILDNPSETILLDFQHFKNDSKEDVYKILIEELVEDNLVLVNNTDKTDLEYINELTLNEARGKCIVFFGETSEDPSDWVFLRNNDDCTMDNMTLDSYYIGEYHKRGFSSLTSDAHQIYFNLLKEKKENDSNGIFVLQCQLTDGKFVFGPWAMERKMEDEMSEYILGFNNESLAKYELTIDDINVVLRDYLTPSKCEEIIKLNNLKSFNN